MSTATKENGGSVMGWAQRLTQGMEGAERCPAGTGPSAVATVGVVIILLALCGRLITAGEEIRRRREVHADVVFPSLVISLALLMQLAAMAFFYVRYRQCDALTGFLVFMVVAGITGFLVALLVRPVPGARVGAPYIHTHTHTNTNAPRAPPTRRWRCADGSRPVPTDEERDHAKRDAA